MHFQILKAAKRRALQVHSRTHAHTALRLWTLEYARAEGGRPAGTVAEVLIGDEEGQRE